MYDAVHSLCWPNGPPGSPPPWRARLGVVSRGIHAPAPAAQQQRQGCPLTLSGGPSRPRAWRLAPSPRPVSQVTGRLSLVFLAEGRFCTLGWRAGRALCSPALRMLMAAFLCSARDPTMEAPECGAGTTGETSVIPCTSIRVTEVCPATEDPESGAGSPPESHDA